MSDYNYQRKGAISNSQVGREFEDAAYRFFTANGLNLVRQYKVEVGFHQKKLRRFDLGSDDPPVIVECRSLTWREKGEPSAKIRGLNEAMLLFSLAPEHYRKILFMLKHSNERDLTLATHYITSQGHLIAKGVEVWEYDINTNCGHRLL